MTSPLGRYAGRTEDSLVPVLLLSAPLLIWQRSAEHHDDLMREMALLALSPSRPDLPTRLLELVEVLGREHGAARARPDQEREAARAAGLDRLDLRYDVPRSTATAAKQLLDLLDEVEQYCRTDLLTLAQPDVQRAFNRWYIDQFVQQCAGLPPEPWPGPWA